MKLEEAIKTALQYENKVYQTYQEAQQSCPDGVGLKIFKVLADEELGHIKYLEACLARWQESGQLDLELLATAIPSPQKIQQAAQKLQQNLKERRPANTTEVDLLNRALQVESETYAFYKQMVSEIQGEGQAMFQRFLQIEEGHSAIVQAEIDSVTGLGFWFDMPEFSLENE